MQVLFMLMNLDLKNIHIVPMPGQKEEKDLREKDVAQVMYALT